MSSRCLLQLEIVGANGSIEVDHLKGYTNVDIAESVKSLLRHRESFCEKSELLFPNRISVEHGKEVSHLLESLKVLHIVPVKVHDSIVLLKGNHKTQLTYEFMNRKPG